LEDFRCGLLLARTAFLATAFFADAFCLLTGLAAGFLVLVFFAEAVGLDVVVAEAAIADMPGVARPTHNRKASAPNDDLVIDSPEFDALKQSLAV